MGRRSWISAFMFMGLLWACGANTLEAQAVRGTVVMADSLPAAGIIVELVDRTGRVIDRTLSRANGGFVVRASVTGAYRLRALRIGFSPTTTDPLALDPRADVQYRLLLSGTPVHLATVRVQAKQVCEVAPDSGTLAAQLWSEARKALMAASIVAGNQEYTVRRALYERRVDLSPERVLGQRQFERDGVSLQPFRSAPADSLLAFGYVRRDASGATYLGPDADALLSDSFAESHCFRPASRPEPPGHSSWAGVEFLPLRSSPQRPDIQGVFWVDRRTSDLRELNFEYTDLPPEADAAHPGGHVEFMRLPSNEWIVGRWDIRMPITGLEARAGAFSGQSVTSRSGAIGQRLALVAIGAQVSGGEVLELHHDTTVLWRGRVNAIVGTVTDEGGIPRSGRSVLVEGTTRRMVTDTAGRFRFESLLPGTYQLTAENLAIDSLGIPHATSVAVRDSGEVAVRLTDLSPTGAVAKLCSGVLNASLALLRVVVIDSATSAPLARVRVSATWAQPTKRGTLAGVVQSRRNGTTDSAGQVSVCGVLRGVAVVLHVDAGPGGGTTREIVVPIGQPYVTTAIRVQR